MQWILWDSDGVLVDTEGIFLEANRQALEERGIQLANDVYREVNLIRGESVITHYLGSGSIAKQAQKHRDTIYSQLIESKNLVIQERAELVKELAAVSMMGLVTGSSHPCIEKLYRGSGLLPLFQFLITEESVTMPKPNSEPYRIVMPQRKLEFNVPLLSW